VKWTAEGGADPDLWFGTGTNGADAFDLKYKRDTGGKIRLADPESTTKLGFYRNGNQATGEVSFLQLRHGLELPYEEFTRTASWN
jgi:hypothetical protein